MIPKIITLGPGIQNANLPFPNRYFFILHQSRKLDSIQIRSKKPESKSKTRCHLWFQTFNQTQFCIRLNRFHLINSTFKFLEEILDKSMYCDDETNYNEDENPNIVVYWLSIVRYTLHNQLKCDEPFELVIYDNYNQIQSYRKILSFEIMYSDQCPCPRINWSKEMMCHSRSNQILQKQINEDLKPFVKDKINFTQILDEAKQRFANHPQTYAFCWYKIVKKQAYKKCFGQYVGFSKFFDQMLLSLMRKTILNDNEFLINLGDWPLSDNRHQPLPIFSWCGSNDTYDIVLPTYEITESVLHAQRGISTDILSTFGKQTLSFTEKENILFWRGRDSNQARLRLIEHSFESPQYYNVSITNFFFFRDKMHKYSTSNKNQTIQNSPYVPFLEFFTNRYQINIDGTVAAYRFPFLMAGNSLVIKQRSKYYEFFYDTIKHMEHFIEIDENLSDLPMLIKSLVEQNTIPGIEALNNKLDGIKQIIWKARAAILRYLLPSSIFCYYYNALNSYSYLLLDDPSKIIQDDLEPIIKETNDNSYSDNCYCDDDDNYSRIKEEL